MSQFNQEPYATEIMNEQQLNQISQAFYSYCKVMRVPKLGAAPIVITVLTGLILTLLITALGESLLIAVAVGAIVSAVFAFLFWLAYRYRVGASKRFNSYLATDNGQMMFSDFASAQPAMNDQFRLGRHYLFIKNGAVLRIDSITDIVRVATRSGVGVSIIVNDENGSMSLPLCRVHRFNDRAEIDEIRNAVLQRQLGVRPQ